MKTKNTLNPSQLRSNIYKWISTVLVSLVAVLFLFPLYWIITGAFKNGVDINSAEPVWWPSEWVMTNFQKLMDRRSSPLFEFTIGNLTFVGPKIPSAILWLINSVVMAVGSMLLTCLTSAMAGYVLAKKKFWGRGIIFGLIVCAMALPKQVILIPLVRQMSSMKMWDTMWAVIFPIVGWPFGVFLLKQFSEGIPTEMVEACRIDGASEWRTFTDVMFPMIKPGVGACAIFTFINAWNDYFMQLIMLTKTENLTIALGIATMQGESSTDFGLLMAGSALASVPIIIIFLIFQKYFTKGITMGAVKG
ncbi:MAG: carbohydrate ABC transporter permease [Ruminococcaceae bacterium]|nr:carbohydrate ABC transporter permease [Oscillospiraceae bacterium]